MRRRDRPSEAKLMRVEGTLSSFAHLLAFRPPARLTKKGQLAVSKTVISLKQVTHKLKTDSALRTLLVMKIINSCSDLISCPGGRYSHI